MLPRHFTAASAQSPSAKETAQYVSVHVFGVLAESMFALSSTTDCCALSDGAEEYVYVVNE